MEASWRSAPQSTRANTDCNFFKNFPLYSGVAGSASCVRYDALWYAVRTALGHGICSGSK